MNNLHDPDDVPADPVLPRTSLGQVRPQGLAPLPNNVVQLRPARTKAAVGVARAPTSEPVFRLALDKLVIGEIANDPQTLTPEEMRAVLRVLEAHVGPVEDLLG